MRNSNPPNPIGQMRGLGLLPAQLALAATVLLTCTVMPQAARPALLIPFTPSAANGAIPWVRAHRRMVLGHGTLPGSVVIRGVSAKLAIDAIASGSLLLAVPAQLCGTAEQAS